MKMNVTGMEGGGIQLEFDVGKRHFELEIHGSLVGLTQNNDEEPHAWECRTEAPVGELPEKTIKLLQDQFDWLQEEQK